MIPQELYVYTLRKINIYMINIISHCVIIVIMEDSILIT